MTGRELIIYILQNNLEDTEIFDDNLKSMFMSVEEAAVKFGCGEASIIALIKLGRLNGIKIDTKYYILRETRKDWFSMKDKLSIAFGTLAGFSL